jgi:trimeric autotransporter adhesin
MGRFLTFPHINGKVYALISDGAGGWFLGGEFENVDVVPRSNIVHILADRTIDQHFNISINKQVKALALKDNLLFIGGKSNGPRDRYLRQCFDSS